jgi:hypothetical protein
MENLIESIRAALTPEASSEARAAGAAACRTILAALEAVPGQPMPAATIVTPDASKIASAVAMLRGVPPEQLLDLAIAKLRAALPAGTDVPAVQPLKFQIVPIVAPATAPRSVP